MSDIIAENTENSEQIPTEKPVLTSSFLIDGKSQAQLFKPMRIGCIVAMAVGIPLVILYVVLSVLSEDENGSIGIDDVSLFVILLCGAVLFALGLVMYLSAKRNARMTDRTGGLNDYEFYETYMIVRSSRHGEDLGYTKNFYADLVKIRETKHYFLLYPTTATLYPVDKAVLSGEERAALRRVLRLQPRSD